MKHPVVNRVFQLALIVSILGLGLVTVALGDDFPPLWLDVWVQSPDSSACNPGTTGLVCAEWFSLATGRIECCVLPSALGTKDSRACAIRLSGGSPVAPPSRDDIE